MSALLLSDAEHSHSDLEQTTFPPLRHPATNRAIPYIEDASLFDEDFTSVSSRTDEPATWPADLSAADSRFSTVQVGLSESKLLGKAEELKCFRKLHFHYLSAACLLAEAGACRGHAKNWRDALWHLDEAFRVRSLLVESNLRLVVAIAKKYAPQAPGSMEELVSCGNTGLVNAVDQFDYRRGFRFSTYAYTAIQRAIFAQLRSEGTYCQRFVEDSYEAASKLTKDASEGSKQVIAAQEASTTVASVLHILDDREMRIVRARFGFGEDASPKSFREIGDTIGLSKQRVGSIYHAAVAKLRRALAA
ncbi:MAG: hypothetical protein Aurels2KO_40750 [Aureliella sp.]